MTAARVRGLSPDGRYERLDAGSPRPVQLLLDGRPEEAARRYVAADPSGADRFVTVARRFLRSAPTRISDAVAYLTELGRLLPDAASVHAALGDALVFAGERRRATRAYERALALDPSNAEAITALGRLGELPAPEDAGWRLPFPLDALFAPPPPPTGSSGWA